MAKKAPADTRDHSQHRHAVLAAVLQAPTDPTDVVTVAEKATVSSSLARQCLRYWDRHGEVTFNPDTDTVKLNHP
jgi:hypothetical protein